MMRLAVLLLAVELSAPVWGGTTIIRRAEASEPSICDSYTTPTWGFAETWEATSGNACDTGFADRSWAEGSPSNSTTNCDYATTPAPIHGLETGASNTQDLYIDLASINASFYFEDGYTLSDTQEFVTAFRFVALPDADFRLMRLAASSSAVVTLWWQQDVSQFRLDSNTGGTFGSGSDVMLLSDLTVTTGVTYIVKLTYNNSTDVATASVSDHPCNDWDDTVTADCDSTCNGSTTNNMRLWADDAQIVIQGDILGMGAPSGGEVSQCAFCTE